jgi:hypothetical protein
MISVTDSATEWPKVCRYTGWLRSRDTTRIHALGTPSDLQGEVEKIAWA